MVDFSGHNFHDKPAVALSKASVFIQQFKFFQSYE